METSRDDFIIAIRSAFLKKGTKQRFSLIVLLFFSSEITPIVNKGVKINSNNGMSSKKLERLAIPDFKILGAGSGSIQISKPVIDKKTPITK